MFEPNLEDMTKMDVTGYRYIPLRKEIYSDFFTPIMVLKKLRSITDHCFILESNEHSNQWGQYSFIGFHPKHEITCNNYRLTFDGFDEGRPWGGDRAGYPECPASQRRVSDRAAP